MSSRTKHDANATSSPLPVARPWTPPDMDSYGSGASHALWTSRNDAQSPGHGDIQSDSGYFGSAVQAPSKNVAATGSPCADSPLHSPAFPSTPLLNPSTHRITTHDGAARGLGIDHTGRPVTPIKAVSYSGAPQYPYTPDSIRMSVQRAHTVDMSSPLPSMPWDSSPPLHRRHSSPVQNALFSCLHNLEHLINTSQPKPEQMEYIIAQFEAMTSYLSAPESTTKQPDDHLFSELDTDHESVVKNSQALTKQEAEAYVTSVSQYVQGVQKHTDAMKLRLDEVKQLNQINIDIIQDLRTEIKQLKAVPRVSEKSKVSSKAAASRKDIAKTPAIPRDNEHILVRRKPERLGFWAALTEALNQFGDALHDH